MTGWRVRSRVTQHRKLHRELPSAAMRGELSRAELVEDFAAGLEGVDRRGPVWVSTTTGKAYAAGIGLHTENEKRHGGLDRTAQASAHRRQRRLASRLAERSGRPCHTHLVRCWEPTFGVATAGVDTGRSFGVRLSHARATATAARLRPRSSTSRDSASACRACSRERVGGSAAAPLKAAVSDSRYDTAPPRNAMVYVRGKRSLQPIRGV